MKTKVLKVTKHAAPFFVAIAAFAVTAAGVHAFSSPELLTKAGLTDEQVVAVQEAQELKASGDHEAAKAALEAAGIDREAMKAIKQVAREAHQAVHAAVEAGDYDAFVIAVMDSPLAEFVTNEAEFELFADAHALRQSGDRDGAEEIFADLGIERDDMGKKHGKRKGGDHRAGHTEMLTELSDDQREALDVAKAANDKEAVRAILEEAGFEKPERGQRGQ